MKKLSLGCCCPGGPPCENFCLGVESPWDYYTISVTILRQRSAAPDEPDCQCESLDPPYTIDCEAGSGTFNVTYSASGVGPTTVRGVTMYNWCQFSGSTSVEPFGSCLETNIGGDVYFYETASKQKRVMYSDGSLGGIATDFFAAGCTNYLMRGTALFPSDVACEDNFSVDIPLSSHFGSGAKQLCITTFATVDGTWVGP